MLSTSNSRVLKGTDHAELPGDGKQQSIKKKKKKTYIALDRKWLHQYVKLEIDRDLS